MRRGARTTGTTPPVPRRGDTPCLPEGRLGHKEDGTTLLTPLGESRDTTLVEGGEGSLQSCPTTLDEDAPTLVTEVSLLTRVLRQRLPTQNKRLSRNSGSFDRPQSRVGDTWRVVLTVSRPEYRR